jgi:hypothetical protein
MELQELVERIQRWRSRQDGGASGDSGYQGTAHRATAEERDIVRALTEDPAAEMEVEPEAIVAEDSTGEVKLDQIEEVD